MLPKLKTFLSLSLLAAVSLFSACIFSACNGGNSSSNTTPQLQPGTATQTAQTGNDTAKKCDSQRVELRKTALEFLGITALQINSDKVMKELTPEDLDKIEKDTVEESAPGTSKEVSDNDNAEITDIVNGAITQADLQAGSTTVLPGTHPERVIHMGPDYLDGNGNFTVGSVLLQSLKGIKVNDIYNVFLGLGVNSKNPDQSFLTYSIGLGQITDPATAANTLIPLSQYVEDQLPPFCKGSKTSLDQQAFNTIPVGASTQPTGNSLTPLPFEVKRSH